MGSFPTSPSSMFGKKKEAHESSGPSLTATDEPVADIRVVGNSTIPTSQILDQLQTRVGRPFDPALIQSDIRKLTSRGWFVNVQPTYEQTANGRVVVFKVVERPIVRYVEYLGNYELRTKKLSKETDLKVGGPVDPYAVQEAKRKIIDLYHRNGFNNAQVSILEGDKPTDHGIVFVINEGAAQKIWKVEFVGNEFVSERRLRTKIDSKPPTMMLFKGYVDRDQIEADTDKLTAFYRSFGYFQAKISPVKEFDEKNKWLTLRFVIHEGPRYQVETVAFIGNKLFSSESLTTGVELKPDPTSGTGVAKLYHYVKPLPPGPQPFEQDRMNSDVAWLKELYGSQGYIFADIRAEPIFLEETGKLRLMYHIDEGRRWRVGNIYVHINGENPHTKIQTALNRLSIQSGQIADIREIRSSERRLQASGLFLSDPVHGVMPKITYHIPEVNDKEMASREGGSGFRGQSPDATGQGAGSRELGVEPFLAPRSSLPASDGPPLIAPPTACPESTPPAPTQTFKVPTPSGYVPGNDVVDVHYSNRRGIARPAPLRRHLRLSVTKSVASPTTMSALRLSQPQTPHGEAARPTQQIRIPTIKRRPHLPQARTSAWSSARKAHINPRPRRAIHRPINTRRTTTAVKRSARRGPTPSRPAPINIRCARRRSLSRSCRRRSTEIQRRSRPAPHSRHRP